MEMELSEVQKNFLLRSVYFLINDGDITQARQLLLRYLGTDTISDEEYAQVEEWTDAALNK